LFKRLALNHNARVMFDPTYPQIDEASFINTGWKAMYVDVNEAFMIDTHTPLGKEVDFCLYVESYHAGDKFTHRSRTGFVIYLNMAPIVWLSKHKPTVESSVFWADVVAIKNGIETIHELSYKLQMMDVPLSGPWYVCGDNMSIIHNTQRP
jgi:hypothetical protein